MKKRGQIVLKYLVDIVIGATVLLFFLYVAKAWGSGEVFYTARLARDSSLLYDALYSVPGNAFISYNPERIGDYYVTLKHDTIIFSQTPDAQTGISSYFTPYSINLKTITLKPQQQLFFYKSGTDIKASTKGNFNTKKLRCPEFLTSGIAHLDVRDFPILDGKAVVSDKLIRENAEVVVIVQRIPPEDQSLKTIKGYYLTQKEGHLKNKKLACMGVNALLDANLFGAIKGTSLIPRKQFPFQTTAELVVIIEVRTPDAFDDTLRDEIKKQINNAVEGYFQ
jgi:hypothetical protein